jgi:hypothetical protein
LYSGVLNYKFSYILVTAVFGCARYHLFYYSLPGGFPASSIIRRPSGGV